MLFVLILLTLGVLAFNIAVVAEATCRFFPRIPVWLLGAGAVALSIAMGLVWSFSSQAVIGLIITTIFFAISPVRILLWKLKLKGFETPNRYYRAGLVITGLISILVGPICGIGVFAIGNHIVAPSLVDSMTGKSAIMAK
ncbi:MAG: hypothetical protein IPM23_26840 [Candidatus Melainabacteria bacterium]|nr:hypothetical protein [Candidatus Melainabacteria bacterium]